MSKILIGSNSDDSAHGPEGKFFYHEKAGRGFVQVVPNQLFHDSKQQGETSVRFIDLDPEERVTLLGEYSVANQSDLADDAFIERVVTRAAEQIGLAEPVER